jgi:hypothetical protein
LKEGLEDLGFVVSKVNPVGFFGGRHRLAEYWKEGLNKIDIRAVEA